MARPSASRWIAALLVLGAIVGPSCAAPSLPLPPPLALVEAPPDAEGMVEVNGNARLGAFVACLNERTEVGIIVRADPMSGDFSIRIPAETGDTITLWQFEASSPGGQQIHLTVP
jgi:hypothetical protein